MAAAAAAGGRGNGLLTSRRRRRLVLTLDDVGKSRRFNAGAMAVAAALPPFATRFSLMMTTSHADSIAYWAKAHNVLCSFHLNITEGHPLVAANWPKGIPAPFFSGPQPFWAWSSAGHPFASGEASSAARLFLQMEVAAQLERYVALLGVPPRHLDGHHYCHTDPYVADVLCAERLSNPALQHWSSTRLRLGLLDEPQNPREAMATAAAPKVEQVYASHGIRDQCTFAGFSCKGDSMTIDNVGRLLARAEQADYSVVELMAHVAAASSSGSGATGVGDQLLLTSSTDEDEPFTWCAFSTSHERSQECRFLIDEVAAVAARYGFDLGEVPTTE